MAPGLHNTGEFAEHFILPRKIVKRFDTDDFCEIVAARGNLLCLTTVVSHIRESAALLAARRIISSEISTPMMRHPCGAR
jgi:hypothetical protein